MTPRTRKSALQLLSEALGIVPKYLDQTGKEWRQTSDQSRAAILSALGIDASTEHAAREALRALREEERRALIAPVQVIPQSGGDGDAPARVVSVRLPSTPAGGASTQWSVELDIENVGLRRASGEWPGGPRADLPLPWRDEGAPPLGYHQIRVTVSGTGETQRGEQLLIVVPPQCTSPADVLGDRKAFGFVTNLYTLRSERNWGVGDFTDLQALVRWAGEAGAAFVGLNPLHALLNRGTNVSPYSPVSRLFRNPIYIDVERVPELQHAPHLLKRLEHPELQAEISALREGDAVRYEQVMSIKMPILEELHRAFVERERARYSARARAYDEFLRTQEPELTQFATWMALAEGGGRERVAGHGANWREWPEELRDPSSDAVRRFRETHSELIDFHRWVQFETDRQLGEAAAEAKGAGLAIGLYQDLAIGTSPTGADTWAFQHLFVADASIGAPPDPYSASGQDWGLPPLDPRALRRDRYRYFIRLVRSGFRHAGALRIDHVMGLFRLFWIPKGKTGKDGAYLRYPADDLLGILALESVRHHALVVGEDLGTVPKEVPPALEKWGVLSSKVLYFERDRRGGFKPSERYDALALATANTHDMATLSGFWHGRDIELRRQVGLIESNEAAEQAIEEREGDKRALLRRLQSEGLVEGKAGRGAMHEGSAGLRGAVHAFLCNAPSVLVGFSLDDLAGEIDPVNVPGVGPDKYPSWTRKMKMSIEEMPRSSEVQEALQCSGRQLKAREEQASEEVAS